MGFLALGCGMTLHHRSSITSGFAQSALFQKITLWSVISTTKGRRDPKEAHEMAVACSAFSFDFIYRISPTGFLAAGCGMTLHHQFPITSGFTHSSNFQKITLWSVISTTKGRRDPIEAYETYSTRRPQFQIEILHIP